MMGQDAGSAGCSPTCGISSNHSITVLPLSLAVPRVVGTAYTNTRMALAVPHETSMLSPDGYLQLGRSKQQNTLSFLRIREQRTMPSTSRVLVADVWEEMTF